MIDELKKKINDKVDKAIGRMTQPLVDKVVAKTTETMKYIIEHPDEVQEKMREKLQDGLSNMKK